jgi:hypothetical protein
MSFLLFIAAVTRGHTLYGIQATESDAGDVRKTERHKGFVLLTQVVQFNYVTIALNGIFLMLSPGRN